MKFTLSWLKDHLETTASLTEITHKLVSLGLEVDNIEDPAKNLHGFVVATVVEAHRHPNADRLSLCYADTGQGERIQVVCGAPNVRPNMKVAFAPVGVTIPATKTILKKGKIRDVESFGMFCSADELGLDGTDEGILDLEPSLAAGTPLAEALGLADPIIDVNITPNRADCFGVRGIARDLAASGLGTLKPLAYSPISGTFPCPVTVTIEDSKACPNFSLQAIQGVRNGPSPQWVQQRLRAVGLRPISALVDVTNYLTVDLGRPLHVFDLGKIQGNLTVRRSRDGETLNALNDKNYTLKEGMTVIADGSGVLSLGGIIGGRETSCLEETVDVLIECASFDPIQTAHTGRALSILSDARTRFERGVDPTSVPMGLEAATNLIVQWCGGSVSQATTATHHVPQPEVAALTIRLTQRKLNSLSGYDIPLTEAKVLLEALGFTIPSLTFTEITVRPPSYRMDMENPEDLVEEILRLKGYDQIPSTPLPPVAPVQEAASLPTIAKRVLASRGLNEVVTWSFMAEDLAASFGGEAPSLRISNPISVDLGFMRPSILPNLIQAAVRNQTRGQDTIALFEVGPQFDPQAQKLLATGLLAGSTGPRHWAEHPRLFDIFDAKAHALAVLGTMGVTESSCQMEASGPAYYHPGRKGTLKQGNRILALFGEIHPLILSRCDGKGAFMGFEVFLDHLPPLKLKKPPLQLSPYQTVVRDFAFVVDDALPADHIIKAVAKVDRSLITDIQVFDVYKGDKLPEGKKSLAIQVRLIPQGGTLTEAQLTDLSNKIVTTVSQATGGILRSL